jgi:hypothetical protein
VVEAYIKHSKTPVIQTVHDSWTVIVPPREQAPQFWEMLEKYWPEAVKEFDERESKLRAALAEFDREQLLENCDTTCEAVYGDYRGVAQLPPGERFDGSGDIGDGRILGGLVPGEPDAQDPDA